jgi:xanthine dehydrogenase accessory factor
MDAWSFIQSKLSTSTDVLLLWVLDSEGSSPGRRGFKMAVAADGSFTGTIGGGIMEHKLVEKARALLDGHEKKITLQRQYHDKQHAKDQSGMICSGNQLIAFVPLSIQHKEVVDDIISSLQQRKDNLVQLTPGGVQLLADASLPQGLQFTDEHNWSYAEKIDQRPVIHIIGGGHVSLALSELMKFLGFYIKLYDNRDDLSTFVDNTFAHEKHVADYNSIDESIKSNNEEYVVIMTFGYRDDKIVFTKLLDKKFCYAGMMGSEAKIETLFNEMQHEGIDPSRWKDWCIPIGIPIFSRTTQEIAISIAAEIIKQKNKALPGGRSKR